MPARRSTNSVRLLRSLQSSPLNPLATQVAAQEFRAGESSGSRYLTCIRGQASTPRRQSYGCFPTGSPSTLTAGGSTLATSSESFSLRHQLSLCSDFLTSRSIPMGYLSGKRFQAPLDPLILSLRNVRLPFLPPNPPLTAYHRRSTPNPTRRSTGRPAAITSPLPTSTLPIQPSLMASSPS